MFITKKMRSLLDCICYRLSQAQILWPLLWPFSTKDFPREPKQSSIFFQWAKTPSKILYLYSILFEKSYIYNAIKIPAVTMEATMLSMVNQKQATLEADQYLLSLELNQFSSWLFMFFFTRLAPDLLWRWACRSSSETWVSNFEETLNNVSLTKGHRSSWARELKCERSNDLLLQRQNWAAWFGVGVGWGSVGLNPRLLLLDCRAHPWSRGSGVISALLFHP